VEAADGFYIYRLEGGVRFRLPTPFDREAVAGLPIERASEELLRRCVLDGGLDERRQLVTEAAMARLAPVLRMDLDAVCAECGAAQLAHFDIAAYLLRALVRERRWLYREVHTLAMQYRWSPNDILSLTREQRRTYVALVRAERAPQGEGLFA
jgi:hypothetical protein